MSKTAIELPAPTKAQFAKILDGLEPFSQWSDAIVKLKKEHPLLGYGGRFNANSMGTQLVTFLTTHPYSKYSYHREHLIEILKHLVPGKVSKDAIQLVNKTEQRGLLNHRFKREGIYYYSIPSVEFYDFHLYKRCFGDDAFKDESKEDQIKRIRAFYQKLANDTYETGHRDPRKPLTADNIVMQPHTLNRAYRDSFIFDEYGMKLIPLPLKLAENTKRFGWSNDDATDFMTGYFATLSADDQQALLEKLKAVPPAQ